MIFGPAKKRRTCHLKRKQSSILPPRPLYSGSVIPIVALACFPDIIAEHSSSFATMGSGPAKTCFATSSPYEEKIGYYRAVRHGNQIFVSGTTSVDPYSPTNAPQVLHPEDARQQTRVALEESIRAIQGLGGKGAEEIVRVKMFVSRHEDCEAVGQGFSEILGKHNRGGSGMIGAAATMIVVNGGFINKEMLVEIEVDAVVEYI